MEKQRFIRSFDGTRLFTASCGEGPALVLCDGIGCDGFIWRYLQAALRQRYTLIRWHYRGHGLSDSPQNLEAVDMAALRGDLAAVLDAYKLDKPVLMGHSMGVQVIFDFALAFPQRVCALVPICGSYGRPLDTLHDNGHAARLFPLFRDAVNRWPRQGQQIWRRFFTSKLAFAIARRFEVNGGIVQVADFWPYFEHLSGMDAHVFVRMLDKIRHHSVEDGLPSIQCPALIIAGERDTFTPAWLSRRMHRLIPHSELLVVPGGSHVAPIEIPELIILRLERFLDHKVFLRHTAGGTSVVGIKPLRHRKSASRPERVN